ncbi:MAG TPA: hypothetical protein VGO59_10440 [Verrucomicrobiae bacterium]|jgi:hypothetical protein
MRQRPVSTLIFGILNIGWALMLMAGLFMMMVLSRIKTPSSNPALQAMQADPNYSALMHFNAVAGAVMGVVLLTFGIGLLLLKDWARLGSIIYSVIDIVRVVVMSMLSWPYTKRMMENVPNVPQGMMQGFAMIGLVVGLLFGVGYPALLLFFMTRPNVIDACQPEQPLPEAAPPPV